MKTKIAIKIKRKKIIFGENEFVAKIASAEAYMPDESYRYEFEEYPNITLKAYTGCKDDSYNHLYSTVTGNASIDNGERYSYRFTAVYQNYI